MVSEITLAKQLEYDMIQTLGKYQTELINKFCEDHIIPTLNKIKGSKKIYFEDQGNSHPTSAQRLFRVYGDRNERLDQSKLWRIVAEPGSVVVENWVKGIKKQVNLEEPEESLEKILKEIGFA